MRRKLRQVLSSLREGELIMVRWYDACTWRDVPNNMRNPKKVDSPIVSMGAYGGLVKGERLVYLRLVVERKPENSDITYIPLVLIDSIERGVMNVPKKEVRNYAQIQRWFGGEVYEV
ncbi:MAG: hypothetical protein QXO17_03105 [Nitrososphaerota archaeon]